MIILHTFKQKLLFLFIHKTFLICIYLGTQENVEIKEKNAFS